MYNRSLLSVKHLVVLISHAPLNPPRDISLSELKEEEMIKEGED